MICNSSVEMCRSTDEKADNFGIVRIEAKRLSRTKMDSFNYQKISMVERNVYSLIFQVHSNNKRNRKKGLRQNTVSKFIGSICFSLCK